MSDPTDYEPRHACAHYCLEHYADGKPVRLAKAEFDALCEADAFTDGPHADSFGDGPYDPYNPFRQAFGTLKDGRVVYAELHRMRQPGWVAA